VERKASGASIYKAERVLHELFVSDPDPVVKIRTLCSLYTLGADHSWLRSLIHHSHESVRAWAIRFLTDDLPIDTVDSHRGGPDVSVGADLERELVTLAQTDASGLVRLVLASTLQRLPVSQRPRLATALVSRADDAGDHNIPAMIWTGLIPVAQDDPDALIAIADDCRIPIVIRLISRRLSEDIESRPVPLNRLLDVAVSKQEHFRSQVFAGMADGLKGWRKARKPAGWDRLAAEIRHATDQGLRTQARELEVLFGDGRALDEVKRLALDDSASIDDRKAALKTLIESRPPDLRAICERLLRVRFLNPVAAGGLALFDDPAIARSLATSYRAFHPSERPAIMDTLTSRPSFAHALLDQIEAGKIPRETLTAFQARQIRSFGIPALTEKLSRVWGELRDSASDRRPRIEALKRQLDSGAMAHADASRGRALFERVCASCHKLYGYGGEIGPDLTGSGRDNLDYLLENVVDPSASLSADFRMVVVAMTDGRILNGMLRAQTERTLTLQTQTEALVLDRGDIEEVRPSSLSLMPDGLLDPLSRDELRDLMAYLMHRTQVPLPQQGR
jgi:putative heme-binding domain-containing protein